MNCPVCKSKRLQPQRDESEITIQVCKLCEGRWLQSYRYWKWKQAQEHTLSNESETLPEDLRVDDSESPKLCPECGHFLIRYPVETDIQFKLDHCDARLRERHLGIMQGMTKAEFGSVYPEEMARY